MKKKVKQYAHQIEIGGLERRHVLKDFSKMLDNQVGYIYVLTNFFSGIGYICPTALIFYKTLDVTSYELLVPSPLIS